MKKVAILALVGVAAMASQHHHHRPHHRALETKRGGNQRPQRRGLEEHHPRPHRRELEERRHPRHLELNERRDHRGPRQLVEDHHRREQQRRGLRRQHPVHRMLDSKPTDAEIEAKEKEALNGFCDILQDATICAKDSCVSTRLGLSGWSDYENFWANYSAAVYDHEIEILTTLAVVGFEWPKIETYLSEQAKRSLKVDLEKDDTLTMWAGAFASYCVDQDPSFDLDALKKYMPMSNDADYFGCVAVNFEIGLGSLIVTLIEKEKWDLEKAGKDLEAILEDHCPMVAFGFIATEIEFTDGNKYWEEVEIGFAKELEEILTYLAEKAGETAKDLPSDAEIKAGAKKIGEAVGKKCAATFKVEEEAMKKAAAEEFKWKCEHEKKML